MMVERLGEQWRRWGLREWLAVGVGAVIALAVVIALIVGVVARAQANTTPLFRGSGAATTPASGGPVDGLTCAPAPSERVHIHLYLAVYANGQPVTVPAGVGVVAPAPPISTRPALGHHGGLYCYYPTHTHNTTGIVHIESGRAEDIELGVFFDLWGQPLSATRLLGYHADAAHQLVAWVIPEHGAPTRYQGDPARIVMQRHLTVYLLFASPQITPRAFTTWGAL